MLASTAYKYKVMIKTSIFIDEQLRKRKQASKSVISNIKS